MHSRSLNTIDFRIPVMPRTRATIEVARYTSFWLKWFLKDDGAS